MAKANSITHKMISWLGGKVSDAFISDNNNGLPILTQGGDNSFDLVSAFREPVVMNCVNIMSRYVAQLKPEVLSDADEVITGTNLLKSINNANDWSVSSFHLVAAIVRDMMMHGNAYVRVLRGGNSGDILGFVIYSPDDVVVEARGRFALYKVREGGKSTEYFSDDMLHFVDIPTGTVIGPSRVKQSIDLIRNKTKLDKSIGKALDNTLSITGILTHDGLTQKLMDEVVAGVKAHMNQVGQNGIVILPQGAVLTEFTPAAVASADLRALCESLIYQIAAIFGVPPSLVGTTIAEKYNNALARNHGFFRDSLYPLKLVIDAGFSRLLPEGQRLELNADDFLAGSLMDQVNVATKLVGGGLITANEGRARLKIKKSDDPEADKLKMKPAANRPDSLDAPTGGGDGPDGGGGG